MNDNGLEESAPTVSIIATLPVSKPIGQSRSLVGYVAAVLGLVMLAAGGFALYWWANRDIVRTEPTIAPIEQLRFQKITDSGDVVFPTISPDGKILAYVRLEEEQSSVWIKQVAGGRHVRYPSDTPLANLLVHVAGITGVPIERIGNSTGELKVEPLSGL